MTRGQAWHVGGDPDESTHVQKLLLTSGLTALLQSETAQDTAYKAASTAAAIGAGVVTRSALTSAWEKATGEAPPNDPTAPGVSWQQALLWAAAAGVGVGVGRVVGRRLTASAFGREVETDEQQD